MAVPRRRNASPVPAPGYPTGELTGCRTCVRATSRVTSNTRSFKPQIRGLSHERVRTRQPGTERAWQATCKESRRAGPPYRPPARRHFPNTTRRSPHMPSNLEHVATFCGNCNCGCPELYVDHEASEDKRVVITDDFGQRIQM